MDQPMTDASSGSICLFIDSKIGFERSEEQKMEKRGRLHIRRELWSVRKASLEVVMFAIYYEASEHRLSVTTSAYIV